MGTWQDPALDRPIVAPLQQCAELLGIDLATIQEAAANVEPYICPDGTRVWSRCSWSGSSGQGVYGRRRGGFLDRRRTRQ